FRLGSQPYRAGRRLRRLAVPSWRTMIGRCQTAAAVSGGAVSDLGAPRVERLLCGLWDLEPSRQAVLYQKALAQRSSPGQTLEVTGQVTARDAHAKILP